MTSLNLAADVVTVDPRSDSLWSALARGQSGSLFTSPPWITAVCESYGFTPRARVAIDGAGRPTAGFAWVPISDLRGDRLVSMPFSDRAEPIAQDAHSLERLMVEPLDSGVPLTIRCLDTAAPTVDGRLTCTGQAAWHATYLDAPLDIMHRALSSGTRRNLAAAQRHGVHVRAFTDICALRRFHGMHVSLRRQKYRLLAQPVSFFERIWEHFEPRDAIVTLLAYVDDDPVAGAVFLAWEDTLYYKFGASHSSALHLRPNEALFWSAISWASERGYRLLDWGLSDLEQPGLIAFKRKWLSEERRIVTMTSSAIETGGAPVPLLSELTRLFTDDAVPQNITEQAGSLLYRYFA